MRETLFAEMAAARDRALECMRAYRGTGYSSEEERATLRKVTAELAKLNKELRQETSRLRSLKKTNSLIKSAKALATKAAAVSG